MSGANVRRTRSEAGAAGSREGKYRPIEDYALIGDGLTAALVTPEGSIDWACFPRFDSPSVFARVLDAERGGYWRVAPVGGSTVSRSYLPDTNILSTVFRTGEGEAELLDFMPPQQLTPDVPGDSAIVRIVRGREGRVELGTRMEPRFNYARDEAEWSMQEGRGVRAAHGDETLTLYADAPLRLVDGGAEGSLAVEAGQELILLLTYRSRPSRIWRTDAAASARRLLDQTAGYWSDWVGRCGYDGPYAEHVRRSALTLKLLDYLPTGAIVAAPTTSLPEDIGGERNWDYRYSWLRDTAFTLHALFGLGYTEEAEAFLEWIADVSHDDPARLQVLYGVGGERRIEEFELPHLEGYRASRPVRIGNAAYEQRQHDIYGEILDCAYLLARRGGAVAGETWDFLCEIVEYVRRIWREPDKGIWEVRSGPQHFVYSKALCWLALDRGIKLARGQGLPAPLQEWEQEREVIAEELLREGYDEEIGSFTQTYGSQRLDAAALALLLRGMLPSDDPRMRSTVDRVAERLSRGGLVHRYLSDTDDGLRGGEGVFLMCSFWLADCYAEMGRVEQARELFERLLGYANDVGLYAEELDPDTGHHLGNFPQAFTHVALINAALSIYEAETKARGGGPQR